MKGYILVVLALCFAADASAAAGKKDFKGLFGSYRREKFIENESRPSDFGFDLLLSTLLPLSPLVQSSEVRGAAPVNLAGATFFNLETGVHLSINYNWQLFGTIGYYNYDTRKENTQAATPQNPLFHHFEMQCFPIIGGVRYRFGNDDIVPYVGVGAGMAYTKRRGYYDSNSSLGVTDYSTVLAAQASLGVEFYFTPRMGIRLETSAFYLKLAPREYDSGGTPALLPLFSLQGSTWSVRYASGLFILL